MSDQGVEMDDNKVKEVTEWPTPSSIPMFQRFLGFAKFYWSFNRGNSMVATPLTVLLHGKPRKLLWSQTAQEAFEQLKLRFTIVPILRHPNQERPFLVEVDTSNYGIGVVLSQQHSTPGKLYPCAFFSRKLTQAVASTVMSP